MNIKIYIADLEAYNNGILKGEWVDLHCDEDELKEIVNRHSNNGNTDWAIHDYEAPFTINEYDDVFKLNELAEELEDCDEEAFIYFVNQGYKQEDAINKAKDRDYTYISRSSNTFSDSDAALADCYIDQVYGDISQLSRETLEQYFDYEAYGKTLGYDFTETSEGNWISSN